MKNNISLYSIGCLIVLNCIQIFPQNEKNAVIPHISIFSAHSYFADSGETKSNNKLIPGSNYALPVVTYYKYIAYNFGISVILREKGNLNLRSLIVKIISPQKVSQVYELYDDISTMDLEKIYDYNFRIETKERGWFTIELVALNEAANKEDSNKEFILDKSQVYF